MPIFGITASSNQSIKLNGLELITSQSFTSVSSVTFNNCFSNDYIQYKIVIDASGTTLAGINLQFRASGSTYTSANYQMQSLKFENGATAARRLTNEVNWQNALGVVVSSRGFICGLEIMNPFQTMNTSGQAIQHYVDGGVQQFENRSFGLTVTNSFDGFVGTTSGGNMTGNMYVYGFSKGV
jgi:hypothetical protein